MKNRILIIAYFVVFLFVGCENNSNETDNALMINPNDLFAKTEYNLDMKDFAMAVNEAINTNKSFRKLVKEEALKKFDGDYDILLSNIVEKPVAHNDVDNGVNTPNKVKTNFTVKDLLEDAFYTLNEENKLESTRAKTAVKKMDSRQLAAASTSTLIDELTEEYPLLQVSVPVHAEDLEDESYMPPVAFIPEEVNEATTTLLPAFKNSELTTVNAVNEPENAVVVIGMNERIIIEPIEEDVPPTPIELTASATSTGILLTWVKATTANNLNTEGYIIYKKSSGATYYSVVGTSTGVNNVSYFDDTITYGTTYTYFITAYQSLIESDISNQVSVTASALQSPQNIDINTASARNTIDLQWDVASIGNTYEVWRRKSGEVDFTKLTDIPGLNNNFYTNTNLEGGKTYSYKVRTKNSNGAYSGWSKVASIHASDRQLLEELKVTQIMFTDKGAVESWWRGDPELKLVVTGSTSTNVVFEILNTPMIQTSEVENDEWYLLEIPICSEWNPNGQGSILTFHWEELDSGKKITAHASSAVELKIPIEGVGEATTKNGLTLDFEIGDEHDYIGEDRVQWWDIKGVEYGGGISCMKWRIN